MGGLEASILALGAACALALPAPAGAAVGGSTRDDPPRVLAAFSSLQAYEAGRGVASVVSTGRNVLTVEANGQDGPDLEIRLLDATRVRIDVTLRKPNRIEADRARTWLAHHPANALVIDQDGLKLAAQADLTAAGFAPENFDAVQDEVAARGRDLKAAVQHGEVATLPATAPDIAIGDLSAGLFSVGFARDGGLYKAAADLPSEIQGEFAVQAKACGASEACLATFQFSSPRELDDLKPGRLAGWLKRHPGVKVGEPEYEPSWTEVVPKGVGLKRETVRAWARRAGAIDHAAVQLLDEDYKDTSR